MPNFPENVWKLTETHAFDETGQGVLPLFGPEPMGVVIIDEKRIMAMGATDARRSPERCGVLS